MSHFVRKHEQKGTKMTTLAIKTVTDQKDKLDSSTNWYGAKLWYEDVETVTAESILNILDRIAQKVHYTHIRVWRTDRPITDSLVVFGEWDWYTTNPDKMDK